MNSTAVPRPAALVDAVVPQPGWLVVVALVGVALIALSAQASIPVPGTPVPITRQTLAALLAGVSCSPQRALGDVLELYLAGALLPLAWRIVRR